jgi:hypothetical protein
VTETETRGRIEELETELEAEELEVRAELAGCDPDYDPDEPVRTITTRRLRNEIARLRNTLPAAKSAFFADWDD